VRSGNCVQFLIDRGNAFLRKPFNSRSIRVIVARTVLGLCCLDYALNFADGAFDLPRAFSFIDPISSPH